MENGFGYSYGGYGYGRNENTPERSVVSVRATVMLFENEMKRWIPSGPFAGLSRIQIYHHTYSNAFRISGIRMDSGEVSLDCDVTQNLVYNHATPIFHQWKQDGRIVGLHFNSENEAKEFSQAIDSALETLNNAANYSTSNYTGYGSGSAVTTARPAFATAETTSEVITPTAKSSPEIIETTTATTITPKAITPEATDQGNLYTRTSPLTSPTKSEPTPEATPTNHASYTPASITPPASSASPSYESTTASSAASSAAAAAAANDPTPKVTSPKFQTSCRFVPKAQTNTTANELSSSSSSPLATTTAPSPPTTTPQYFGTSYSSIPPRSPSYRPKETTETKDQDRGGFSVVQSQPSDVVSVSENQSTDSATNIPTVTATDDPPAVPPGPPPFVPPPPPPPPPPPVCITAPCVDLGSALQGAQLRKRTDEESGGCTLSRSASPSLSDLQSDIMSEMARKLKERKARADASPSPVPSPANTLLSATASQLEPVTLQDRRGSFDRGQYERRPSVDRCRSPIPAFQPSSATSKPPAVNNITDSPKFPRSKRIQSLTGQEGPPSVGSGAASGGQGSYVTSAELESVKQELMTFVKTEVTKAKQEIIDAVRLLMISSRQQ